MALFLSTSSHPPRALALGGTPVRVGTVNSYKVICPADFSGAGHLRTALSPRSHSQGSAASVSLSPIAVWYPEPCLP